MTTDHAHRAQITAPPPDGPAGVVPDDGVVVGVFETAYSIKELAEQLQVSCQTIYDLRSQGRGPTGFRVGRQLRFRRSEVEAGLLRMEAEDLDRHAPAGR